MEEKSLLKEITFLSRLIGQHKSKLKSAPRTHHEQKRTGVNPEYRFYGQNAKSRYSKVNCTLPQNKFNISLKCSPTKQSPKNLSEETNTKESKLLVERISKIKTSNCEAIGMEKNKLSSNTSVHINPNFLTSTKIPQEEIANLRCKSVYINPKLMSVGSSNRNLVDYNEGRILSQHPVINSQPTTKQIGECSKITHLQSTVENFQISSEKQNNALVPLQNHGTKRKYIYHSKTNLVKAVRTPNSTETKQNRKYMPPVHLQNAAKVIITPRGGTLLSVSRTKLVRLPGKPHRPTCSKSAATTSSTSFVKSRYSLKTVSNSSQSSLIVRSARKVRSKYRNAAVVTGASSKYKFDRRTAKGSRKETLSSRISKYTVDHRSSVPSSFSSCANRVQNRLMISPMRRSFSNRTWTSITGSAMQKVAISHKKLSRIGCSPGTRNYLQSSSLVRIGGFLYKSSRTKLVLSRTPEARSGSTVRQQTVVKRRSLNAGHIVHVRGNKFVMDQSGKTLKRVAGDANSSSSRDRKKPRVSRVDFGGFTYIQKSPSVWVRTNTHTARNVVSTAKQRSIAFFAKKMRKINTPCLFYRRFGRCPRQKKDRCELAHDPKCIDICKKFLQGKCELEGCLLSHDVGPEKMPTCRFFLEGCCVRDRCPYLHVKVNDRAPICHKFLQGYCDDGPECLKRHVLLCPEFDKKGSCAKGKYCQYPHSSVPCLRALSLDSCTTNASEKRCEGELHNGDDAPKRKLYFDTDCKNHNKGVEHSPARSKRYYERYECDDEESWCENPEKTNTDDVKQNLDDKTICNVTVRKRPRIGDLPSFIALESAELE